MLENEARRLGMVKPGERAFVVEGLPGADGRWRPGRGPGRSVPDRDLPVARGRAQAARGAARAPARAGARRRPRRRRLRRRLGGRFRTDELVALYDEGTTWVIEIATRVAPEDPEAVDPRIAADAAFARFLREASDYAGGRRVLEDA